MRDPTEPLREARVLVLAPTARDATLSRSVLAEAGLACDVCADLAGLCRELGRGAGALLLTEEVLAALDPDRLVAWLRRQPAWSDLPILLLCGDGADSPAATWAMELLGNVTVLERPVRVTTLVSTVRTALKARRRQYELRNQVEAVRESEGRLRAITDNATTAIFLLDAQARCTFMNPAAEAMTGFRPDELAGCPFHDRLHHSRPDGSPFPAHECAIVRHVLARQPLRDHEDVFVRKDGTRFPVRCALRPIANGGAPAGTVLEFQDITEQKRAEEALRDADRRKDEFLATLAHELRNPLAPIRNAVQLLGMVGPADPEREELRKMIERQLGHMVRLVDDLLEVSRITRGKIQLQRERLDLAKVVQNAIETSGPLIEAGRHRLTVTMPPEPLAVEGDAVRLTQVLTNLLNNAAKYTPEGGHVWLAAERQGRDAVVRVRDNGPGIPADMLSRVFDLFTQVDSTVRRSQGGLGIGLALVKRLVEMHGGAVEARSDGPGTGAEFVVRLPLALGSTEADAARSEGRPAHAGARRVLVVDDNMDAADSLAMLLSLGGHEVRTAYDGPAGIEQAARFRPEVVLLDLGMPGMDGYETGRRVRELPGMSGMKLVALTGWGQEGDRRRTQEAGFDAHLVKPVDPAALGEFLAGFGDSPAVANGARAGR